MDLPNLGIEPRYPTFQVDSLPAELQGKPKNTGVGSLSLLQGIFPTQESSGCPALQEDSSPTELSGKWDGKKREKSIIPQNYKIRYRKIPKVSLFK